MRFLPLIMLLLLAGCPAKDGGTDEAGKVPSGQEQASPQPVQIWADNSLALALDVLDELFVEQYPPCYQVTYWESAELSARLQDDEQPIKADVILSSSPADLEYLLVNGKVEDSAVRTFAGDRLAIIKRLGETWAAKSLFDIYPLYFKQLGYCTEDVECGRLAQQALISSGVMPRVAERLSRYGSEGAVVQALLDDEIQLGIVLKSTASQHKEVELMLDVEEDLHEDIRYRAYVLKGNLAVPGVAQLLKFLAEDMQTQLNLEALGYVRRANAMQED